MDDKLQVIEAKLDRILAILDAKEHKKLQDKDRIKAKRDEEAVVDAKRRGAIVVERMEGTCATDNRLPYKKWAYICLEFDNALHFLRWVVNEYLGSYHCLQDGRKRMIARNGNYWKSYKSCGTAMLLTPVDMFGGPKVKWDDTLQVQMLKWCYFHVKPVLEHLVKEPRLEYVHEKHLPWDDEKVCQDCGDPLPLEPRWWRKSTRFQEIMQASFAPYSMGYVRTGKGSMLIDFEREVLERPETKLIFTQIWTALREGVTERAVHEAWMTKRRLKEFVERGTAEWTKSVKQDQAARFMEKLKRENAIRLGMQIAVRAKEEGDLQVAIQRSIKEI